MCQILLNTHILYIKPCSPLKCALESKMWLNWVETSQQKKQMNLNFTIWHNTTILLKLRNAKKKKTLVECQRWTDKLKKGCVSWLGTKGAGLQTHQCNVKLLWDMVKCNSLDFCAKIVINLFLSGFKSTPNWKWICKTVTLVLCRAL